MARIFSSGFELNSATTGVEFDMIIGSPSIVTSPVRTGTYAGAITSLTSSTGKGFTYTYAAADANGPYWFRFYLNVTTRPNVDTTIANFQQAAGIQCLTVVLQTTGKLQLWCQDGLTQIGSASAVLTNGTWYRVEMKFDNTPASGSKVGELKLDGATVATSSTLTSTNYAGGVSNVTLGGNLEGETATTISIAFDDIGLNDSTGSFQNTYLGAGQVCAYLRPNAAGDNNAFTVQVGGTAGAANNYTRVNEITPNDITSYNGDVLSGDIDDFNIDNTPSSIGSGDTINVVHVGVRYRAALAAAEAAFKVRIKKAASGTVTSSTAITPNSTTWKTNANTFPINPPLTLYQDPDSSAWTKATLDTAQIGYTISTTNTNAADISTVWMIIDSTPVAAPVLGSSSTLLMMGV